MTDRRLKRRKLLEFVGGTTAFATMAGSSAANENHLVLFSYSDEHTASYGFEVSGQVERTGRAGEAPYDHRFVTMADDEDEIGGDRVTGGIAGGGDAYRFTGELEAFSIERDGDYVFAYLNGRPLDDWTRANQPRHLVMTGGDENHAIPYRFEVTHTVGHTERAHDAPVDGDLITEDPEDDVRGRTVDGALAGGIDAYYFVDELTRFDVDDCARESVRVWVDGTEVDPCTGEVGTPGGKTPNADRIRPPRRTLTVQPNTQVLFEVGAVDPAGSQTTEWYLDGENVGSSFGPWYIAYYNQRGADYWTHTFESSRRVTAEVDPEHENRRYTTTWDVEVASNGSGPPSIPATRPPTHREIERVRGETIDLELDAVDPDGALDQVVWWLVAHDVIHDVTSIGGAEATADTSVDAETVLPEGVVAWVIDENGCMVGSDAWTFTQLRDGDPGTTGVTILETNDPVGAGGILEVVAQVENSSSREITRNVALLVGEDRERFGERTVTVGPGGTERVTFEYETYPVEQDVTFPVYVVTEDDEAQRTVAVHATANGPAGSPGHLSVTISGANDPVQGGERLEVTARVDNTGDDTVTQDVRLLVGEDRELVQTQTVTVEPGGSQAVRISYETYPVEQRVTFPVAVATDDDQDTLVVEVHATGG